MEYTLTIRLDPKDRSTLQEIARARGLGISALVRELAEAEARRARHAAIRAESERIAEYLATHPESARRTRILRCSGRRTVLTPDAGSIVLVDRRSGALAQEPNRIRPAVVVSNAELFPESYPNIIVVPLTTDENIAHPHFSQRIDPTSSNGATRVSWALAHHITSVAKQRIMTTSSKIDERQLQTIREQGALAIGV